jgi:hypothetical protein
MRRIIRRISIPKYPKINSTFTTMSVLANKFKIFRENLRYPKNGKAQCPGGRSAHYKNIQYELGTCSEVL